jgi:predicted NBD/HSP70 family sugar kinase
MRLANERLILSLVRRTPGIAKAEIARATGLTPQATTIIVNRLEADGLLRRQTPQRGRVGQPAVPYALDPDGAFALGLVVGRRGCDIVLADFVARVRCHRRLAYPYPDPATILAFAVEHAIDFAAATIRDHRRAPVGLGVAMPFELWSWEEALKTPPGALARWRDVDLGAELAGRLDLPVSLCNDATAACGAEFAFGPAIRFKDVLYIYVSTFVGGGLVLDGRVVMGRSGNAGAVGSLPVPDTAGGVGQLIGSASLQRLQDRIDEAGAGVDLANAAPEDWRRIEPEVAAWIAEMAPRLALAAAAAAALVEIEAVVIDGAMPETVRGRIVAAVVAALADIDRQGLTPFTVEAGTLGAEAPVLGAVALNFADGGRVPAAVPEVRGA